MNQSLLFEPDSIFLVRPPIHLITEAVPVTLAIKATNLPLLFVEEILSYLPGFIKNNKLIKN